MAEAEIVTTGAAQQPAPDSMATGDARPPVHTSFLNAPLQIVDALRALRNRRARLKLRIDGDPTLYEARILDVTGEELLLEDLVPRTGLSRMTPGCLFSFSARAEGMYVNSAENRVARVDEERGIPFFRVPLPASVLFQQRRRAARYRLPLGMTTRQATITLLRDVRSDRDHGNELAGRVIDISAGGCRVEIAGPIHPPLAEGERLKGCAIEVPNLLEIVTDAAVRHSCYEKRVRLVTCGLEFTRMPITDRRRLEQFIGALSKIATQSRAV
jgi:c-di-GMP-binding flagellar brake protein YcgR